MSKKEQSVYTITIIVKDTGRIAHIQTYSNKKYAEEKLARLNEIWFGREKDGESNHRLFTMTLSTTRLRRKSRFLV